MKANELMIVWLDLQLLF